MQPALEGMAWHQASHARKRSIATRCIWACRLPQKEPMLVGKGRISACRACVLWGAAWLPSLQGDEQ